MDAFAVPSWQSHVEQFGRPLAGLVFSRADGAPLPADHFGAEELGITVVTPSAKDAGNPARRRGHLDLSVAAETYGLAETCHAATLHCWMDLVQMKDGRLS
jgi:hypothetical protein